MHDVLVVPDQNQIPELNVYQCGTYRMHSLEEAKNIARTILLSPIAVNHNEDLTLDETLIQH